MWFLFAIITFTAWGCADLFYKKGSIESEKYSHLKTSIAVGVVMGIVAVLTIIIKDIDYDLRNLYIYLPVSLMYILSMTVGYFGLRYLELSISSPIQNASGAVSALIMMFVLFDFPSIFEWIAIVLITVGIVMLGVFERKEAVKLAGEGDKRYKMGFIAFFMPIAYCVIDSLGTALDGIYLDDFSKTPLVGVTEENFEDVANISYMLTFLIVAVILSIFVFGIKREKPELKASAPKVTAAAFEAAGQLTYVYAIAENGVVAAPVIASYSVLSVVLARIFLKEKLNAKQYVMIGLVFAGILILGVLEGIEG